MAWFGSMIPFPWIMSYSANRTIHFSQLIWSDVQDEEEKKRVLHRTMKERYHFLRYKFFILNYVDKKQGAKEAYMIFKCRLCNKFYTGFPSSVTNLKKHVKRCHEALLVEYEELWEAHKSGNKADERGNEYIKSADDAELL